MPNFTPLSALIIEVFKVIGGERRIDSLEQCLNIAAGDLIPTLEDLVQRKLVCQGLHKARRYALTPAGSTCDSQNIWQESSHPLVRVLMALGEGTPLTACEVLVDHMDDLLMHSRVNGALLCLEWALHILECCAAAPLPDARRFVRLALAVADASMYLTKYHKKTMHLCQMARQAAHREGDRRTMALLQLMEACLENMAAECSPARAQELNMLCEDALYRLDDSDTGSRALYFMGIISFWRGHFQQVLQSFKDAQLYPQLWQCRFQTEMFALYTSSAALYLGRAHQSVGILEAARRAAELAQDAFKIMWWETQLALVLLYLGRDDEALALLDHVISTANPESETKILIWGLRGLAFYHYRRGNLEASHTIMNAAMVTARQNGFKRPIYSYPWMFEILHAYEKYQLPPIEGLHIDDEIERALQGGNLHLHAAALRTQAIRLHAPASAKQREMLHQSLKEFAEVGNTLETKRTRDILKNIDRLSLSTLDQLADANHAFLPTALLSAPSALGDMEQCPANAHAQDIRRPAGISTHDSHDLENNCRQALYSIHALTEFSQFVHQMTYIAACEMGAERAALLRVEHDGTLHVAASCNISEAELHTGHLAARLARIQKAIGTTPLLMDENHAFSLILPLRVHPGNYWLLYMESTYAIQSLSSIAPATQEALMHLFTGELHTAVRVQREQSEAHPEGQELARTIPYQDSPQALLHGSPITRKVLSHARQLATTNAPVLILGETGVGKELLARYIHDCSDRTGAFVPVHPASIPDGLFESEFFGHEKGSFTGAHKRKIGLAELAHKGTLFVDEVSDIPAPMQVKLLRVFQDQRFLRVGGTTEICSEFRLVGATNKDLWQEVQEGRFREDLYYQMSVVPLTLPPLRERREDIEVLVRLFVDRYSRRYHRNIPEPSMEEMQALQDYLWPGNVRELKSVVERAVILYTNGLIKFDLPTRREKYDPDCEGMGTPHGTPAMIAHGQDTLHSPAADFLHESMSDWPDMKTLEARYIRQVLAHTHKRITGPHGALKILGMKRSTLYARMKEYGIS